MEDLEPPRNAFSEQVDVNSQDIRSVQIEGSGAFSGSKKFKISSARFEDNSTQYISHHYYLSGQHVVRRLSELAQNANVELDSRARFPQPECFPGTRVKLIDEIKKWMEDQSIHNPNALWLHGPMGVGKSALAQTLGNWAEEQNILGAAIFLSEGNNDPYLIFVSVAYQLAKLDIGGPYTHRVAQELVDDLRLQRSSLAGQFRALIDRPLSNLKPLSSTGSGKKLIIIIDGLDECFKQTEECEILRLISKSCNTLPIRWLICSRPESYLRRTVIRLFKTDCLTKEISTRGQDSTEDITLFVRKSFEQIAKNVTVAGEVWTAVENINKIVDKSSGLFLYARTIIKFIDTSTPESQLKIIMNFLANSDVALTASPENLLGPLDTLYQKILSRVEKKFLPTTLQLLGIYATYPELPALQLANLMSLKEETFYAAVEGLHSVLHIPPAAKAATEHLRPFHMSFFEFLRNPPGVLFAPLLPQNVHSTFAEACFRVLSRTEFLYATTLPWAPPQNIPHSLSVAHYIFSYASANVWAACVAIGEVTVPSLLDLIINFKFTKLKAVEHVIPPVRFCEFVEWLSQQIKKDGRPNIIKWNGADPHTFEANQIGNKYRCFTLGQGPNAALIQVNSRRVSVTPSG